MSKLSEKFASAKKEIAERAAAVVPGTPSGASLFPRAAGPLHGSVSTMKLDMLKSEIDVLKAGTPVLKIDPSLIKASSWANRHEDAFASKDFAELKAEIEKSGGNVQAIKVRPLNVVGEFKYEIVFGHRRHRACLDLGIDVSAVVEELDEKGLFVQMDRENRQRADLRPYEQGVMYKRALDGGLFPSQRKLAEEIGVDVGSVSKAVAIAELPERVLECFSSRLDIQYRWSADISKALVKEPDLILARAAEITRQVKLGNPIPSPKAYERLVGKSIKEAFLPPRKVTVGKRVLTVSERNNMVSFEVDGLAKDKLKRIEKFIEELMAD